MAYIASWLNEHQQTKEADLVIDETLTWLKQRSGLLDKYVPLKTYSSRNFLMYVVNKIRTVASIISYGAEPPVVRLGNFNTIDAKMFKVGLSVYYDEDQQWQMKEAMELARLKNVSVQDQVLPDGSILKGSNEDLANLILGSNGTIADITRSIGELLNYLTWQALQNGSVNYTDPRTNATPLVLDYKNPSGGYNHFPAALTGNDSWDRPNTANALAVLEEDVETFTTTNGFKPDLIVMPLKVRRAMLNQESTRQAVASMSNNSAMLVANAIGSVGPEMLMGVLERRELPPIITFDEQFEMEDANKNQNKMRFLNNNRYVFLTKNMGERAMGPTLEGDGREGAYVVTREVQKFPPVDATQGVATALPAFGNPKLFFSRQVITE